MSFTTVHTSILIGTGTLLSGGITTAVEEEPNLTEEGWDSLKVTYALRRATLTAEELATLFPMGAQLGSRKWWITGARRQRKAPGFWLAEVGFKGWASSKAAKIKVGSAAESQGGKNIGAPRFVGDTVGAVFATAETHESMPTMSVTYLVENISTGGKTHMVGTAQTPPVTIEVPPTVWGFLSSYTYHWPNGWVLMGTDQDRIPGTSVAMVIDQYKYIREKTPG